MKTRTLTSALQLRSVYSVVYLVVMAAGIIFRIAQYLANRSLWLDEVYLADNILQRSYLELLRPLDDNQSAPILFLFLERLAVDFAGASEYALRLVPLASGVVSVFLFFVVARAFLKDGALAVALVMFAVSEPLIYYASEVKQYSTDVAIALTIYALAIRIRSRGFTLGNLLAFMAIGVVAVWLSDPSVFVLAALGSEFMFRLWQERDVRHMLLLGGVATVWGSGFAMNYFVRLGHLGNNLVLQNYWKDYFAPLLPTSLADLKWYLASFADTIRFLFQNISALLAGLMLAFGLLPAVSRKIVWFMLAPLLFALMASGLRYYPFHQRFLLFTLPALIVLMALGMEFFWHTLTSQSGKFIGALLIGLLILPPTWNALVAMTRPRAHEDIRPVIAYVLQHRMADDNLYVYYSAERPLQYYLRQWRISLEYVTGVSSRDNWMRYLQDLDQLRGKGRVWVLFSHVLNSEGVDEEKLFVQYLNHIGRQLDSFHREGATVYLYDVD